MGEDFKFRVGKDLLTLSQASLALSRERWASNDWLGLPLLVPGLDLVLEPRYKHKYLGDFRWSECYDEDGVRHAMEPGQSRRSPSHGGRLSSGPALRHLLLHQP